MIPMLRALILWLAMALPAAAQELPDWDYNSVNDFAGILSNDDTRIIDQALIALNEDTGVEGTVVTLTDRARYGGTDGLESFATRLFNDWGIGNPERNDGFMILFLRDDREARIELGAGYPASFDRVAQEIMDDEMLPRFREEDYSTGLRRGLIQVSDRIARPHAGGETPAFDLGALLERHFQTILFGVFAFFFNIPTVVTLRRWLNANRCPKCRERGLIIEQSPRHEDLGDGTWRVQTDETRKFCPNCEWSETKATQRRDAVVLDRSGRVLRQSRNPSWTSSSGGSGRSRGGGGRSGGFSGGRSGGGGASGRW